MDGYQGTNTPALLIYPTPARRGVASEEQRVSLSWDPVGNMWARTSTPCDG